MKKIMLYLVFALAIIGNSGNAAIRYLAKIESPSLQSAIEVPRVSNADNRQKPPKHLFFRRDRATKLKDGKLKAWLLFGLAELLFILAIFLLVIGIGLFILPVSFYYSTKAMTLFRPDWSLNKRRWLGVLFLLLTAIVLTILILLGAFFFAPIE